MQVRNILLADIQPSALNPRKTFEEESLSELAANIKENGLLQPITVRKLPKSNEKKFEIVCGERRYRACQIVGLKEIQAIVRDVDDKQAFAMMIIENLQRKDVDPMEEAAAFSKLYENGTRIKTISKMLGKSTAYVASRINLSNINETFVALFRDGMLSLTHLLEICKLTHEQQETLFNARFSPEQMARRLKKTPSLQELRLWIDEDVMRYLDTARFDLNDESFSCKKNCNGCPFNTKNKIEYADEKRYRCMKPSCFNQKTKESVFREAKASGLTTAYVGNGNGTIIEEAKVFGLSPTDYSNRQYVCDPEEPVEANFIDKEWYEKRLRNYKHVKAIFDSNVNDGTVEKVYELCAYGNITGFIKYAFSVPEDTSSEDVAKVEYDKARISTAKGNILKYKQEAEAEIINDERKAFIESPYSKLNTPLSGEEQKVFHALLLKFISYSFKKELGLSWENSEDAFKNGQDVIEKNRNAIKREFIKTLLTEPTVCQSHDLAGMLKFLMQDQFPDKAKGITNDVYASRDKKIANAEKIIAQLQENDYVHQSVAKTIS